MTDIGVWLPICTAPKDGTEVDLWCWNKKLKGADPRVRGGLGRPIVSRTMGWRLTGYHWDVTHKCFRRTEDAHYINTPNDEYFDIAFWMPAPPAPPRPRTRHKVEGLAK